MIEYRRMGNYYCIIERAITKKNIFTKAIKTFKPFSPAAAGDFSSEEKRLAAAIERPLR